MLKDKKGFSLIELIVVIAIVGILVMLATPKFMGYIERAELARIQHDVKIMEDKMAEDGINGVKDFVDWDDNSKDLGLLVLADLLYETEGKAKNVAKPRTQYGDVASSGDALSEIEVASDYKIMPLEMSKKIKTTLPGTFYTNVDGKVYYEHDKPLKNAKEDIILGCEAPEPLDYNFDHVSGTIVKYNGTSQHLVIPSAFKVGNKCWAVRIIGRDAFSNKNIIHLGIPNSVTIIKEDAFRDNKIVNVVIPPSVKKIEDGAFSNNSIGASSGSGGSGGLGVTIQGHNGEGGGIIVNSGAFSGNGPSGSSTILPIYKVSTPEDLKVTASIKKDKAGKDIGVITGYKGEESSIVIPETIEINGVEVLVKQIDKGVYQGKGLITVSLPFGLEFIGDYAFAGNQLVEIIVPKSVNHVGNYAFAFNEVTNKKDTTDTIKSIKIQDNEYMGALDSKGDITEAGKKIKIVKNKTKLLNHIFVTSNNKVLIYIENNEDSNDKIFEDGIHVNNGKDITTSPGPKRLIAGDINAGYFGLVPASELFTGQEISSATGITEGILQNNDAPWLKFAIDGKIIFKSQKSYRHSISWSHINNKGAVFGRKTVNKNGNNYKVRLIKGAKTDSVNQDRGVINHGSEWNRLMLPIHEEAMDNSFQYKDNIELNLSSWGNIKHFTDSDLGLSIGSDGSRHWCQEDLTGTGRKILRGPGISNSFTDDALSKLSIRGWSPVLEWTNIPFSEEDDNNIGSPGPDKLIAGNMDAGYFGLVPASELFTGQEISSATGITEGILQNNDAPWLKFAIDGKIIFKSQKSYRHSISWSHIDNKGAVFGTKIVNRNGNNYKVRLMKGAKTDSVNQDRGVINHESEWNRLMLPIHEEAINNSFQYKDNVKLDFSGWNMDKYFTDTDLGLKGTDDGSRHWCQENLIGTNRKILRGPGISNSFNDSSLSKYSIRGWSPVLEWIN